MLQISMLIIGDLSVRLEAHVTLETSQQEVLQQYRKCALDNLRNALTLIEYSKVVIDSDGNPVWLDEQGDNVLDS